MPHHQSTSSSTEMCKSSFTFTFAVEIVDNEIFEDFTEGWLKLEHPIQSFKLSYHLYPGIPNSEIHIYVWPHCAKITHNGYLCWVRTWLFLERRWLTFSISHLITARVAELLPFTVSVQPGGLSATTHQKDTKVSQEPKVTQDYKSDHSHPVSSVYFPPLLFGEQRYFASVLLSQEDKLETFSDYVVKMLDELINSFVPLSVYDEVFEQPHPVIDIRHKDAIINHVRESILNKKFPTIYVPPPLSESSDSSKSKAKVKLSKENQSKKASKEKDEKKPNSTDKDKKGKEIGSKHHRQYELFTTGNEILAGTGRIIQLNMQNESERPKEIGEVIALLSTNNFPAPDDTPVFFVNIESLSQIPVKEFEKARINDVRTVWRFGGIEHSSERHYYQSGKADFCYHQAVPLHPDIASDMIGSLLDNPLEIEIHGYRLSSTTEGPLLFGYDPRDTVFNMKMHPIKVKEENEDVTLAVCKIDLQPLATGSNGLIRGDFFLEAPAVSIAPLGREALCTNDFNATKSNLVPELVVQPYILLESSMFLEVSIGLVGCKPRDVIKSFSRFFCIIKESDYVMTLLTKITEINEYLIACEKKDDLLTGFALDTGNEVFVYLEGPRDGQILHVWEMTEDFYPSVRPLFSTSSRYGKRIYPDLLAASVPVIVLKMYVPLNCLLACPPLYTKPGAPLPARTAILKIGRIIAGKLYYPPTSSQMPTIFEMRSFRLEFCSPPKLITTWPDQNKNFKMSKHENI